METIKRLLILFKPYWGWMLVASLFALTTVLANIALLTLAALFIGIIAVQGNIPSHFTSNIRILAGIRIIGRYIERIITHEATFRLLTQLRVWFYQSLEPLAPAILEKYQSGDILSRIRADIDALDHFYLRVIIPLAVAFITSIIVVIFIAFYNISLAIMALFFLVLSGVIIPLWVQKQGKNSGKNIIEHSALLRSHIIEKIQGMAELQVYGAQAIKKQKILEEQKKLLQAQYHLQYLQSISSSAVSLSAYLALITAIIMLLPLLAQGNLEQPYFAMLIILILASFEAIHPIPIAFQYLGKTLTAAQRIFTILDAKAVINEPEVSATLDDNLTLTFNNVSLFYNKIKALDNISFDIPYGKHIAVIGTTGAGKSSLFRVLMRFWEYQGHIYLGNNELRNFHSEKVRDIITVVSQKTHIFNTSIKENILLAKPNANQEELINACKQVKIHDFIMQQPEQYETFVGEAGIKLSGGQARRVALARALLKQAPILLLDEPTEGLDNAVAQEILQEIFSLMKNKTIILITHRLIDWRFIDEVLVLEKGQLVEQGQPKALMENQGYFYQLHTSHII